MTGGGDDAKVHASPAQFARRAIVSRSRAIDLTPKSVASFRLSRSREEGRLAIVTDVGNGMRWTHIAERIHCATSGVCADGEVVWFWRSDAGAKVAESSANDGGNQAWSPGRARRKPLKPLCRECRLMRCTLGC